MKFEKGKRVKSIKGIVTMRDEGLDCFWDKDGNLHYYPDCEEIGIDTPKHYDNTNGSLYKFAENHKLNAWEFDIIKRIVRSRKKGNFIEDLNKTIEVIKLYKDEYKQEEPIRTKTY